MIIPCHKISTRLRQHGISYFQQGQMGFDEYYVGQLEGHLGCEILVMLAKLVMNLNHSATADPNPSQAMRGKGQHHSHHRAHQHLHLKTPKAEENFDPSLRVQVMVMVGDQEHLSLVGTLVFPNHHRLHWDGAVH
jgi:hypothetical protein